MPMTVGQMIEQMRSAGEGNNPYAEAAAKEKQMKLQNYLQGQQEAQRAGRAKEMLNDPDIQNLVNEGGSYSVNPENGSVNIGGNPYAKAAGKGAQQAQSFIKGAQGQYKGINDQLDSSKSTLDNLNLGNSTGDKLALINEAKLSLAGSGGRAVGQMVSQLAGDPTMASDSQKAINWLNNTPNLPTLQPAQRDAIRESVFNRLPSIQQQHQQTSQQLLQQGPYAAPQTDSAALVNTFSAPVNQKLDALTKMQQQYQTQRQQMQPQPNVSNPSTANANPTTLDRLTSFFGGKKAAPQQQPQAQPQGQAPQQPPSDLDDINAALQKKAQAALKQQQTPQPGQGQ